MKGNRKEKVTVCPFCLCTTAIVFYVLSVQDLTHWYLNKKLKR